MNSSDPKAAPDLELRFPATPEDVKALRRASSPRPLSIAAYLELLAQLPVSYESLRARKGPFGEPFRL